MSTDNTHVEESNHDIEDSRVSIMAVVSATETEQQSIVEDNVAVAAVVAQEEEREPLGEDKAVPAHSDHVTDSVNISNESSAFTSDTTNSTACENNNNNNDNNNSTTDQGNNNNSSASNRNDNISLKERLKQGLMRKKAGIEPQPSTHVRIDNFQRPLNFKLLLQWLTAELGWQVNETQLWLNTIKTHGYLDVESVDQAKLCIEKLTGKRYPSTSTATLVVHYTEVSAAQAPTHPEAALKPNEWRNPPSAKAPQEAEKKRENKRKLSNEESEGKLPLGESSSKGKASLVDSQLLRKVLVANAADENRSKRVRLESRKEKIERFEVSLDDLFRKTVAQPPVYWLPVSEEVAQKRRQARTAASS
eukprot:gene83-90_t